jgi:hypothetical protein
MSYSPACRVPLPPKLDSAATRARAFRESRICRENWSVVENPALVVRTIGNGLAGGKVGFADPTGPMMNTVAASSPAVAGHAAEVKKVMALSRSVPVAGLTVRLPREPAGGAALATGSSSNPSPTTKATTRAGDNNRGKTLSIRTM